MCCPVQKNPSGQEGRRSVLASTGAKTRLGVRQNTGLPPPQHTPRPLYGTQQAPRYYQHFSGTGFITRTHRTGERERGRRGKRSSSRRRQPSPRRLYLVLSYGHPGLRSAHRCESHLTSPEAAQSSGPNQRRERVITQCHVRGGMSVRTDMSQDGCAFVSS